jgi:hypothetical protein
VTADRQREFISRDAAAVIGNLDQASACLARFDPDLPRAGINRIFEQFFHNRRGSVHHFPGGNL